MWICLLTDFSLEFCLMQDDLRIAELHGAMANLKEKSPQVALPFMTHVSDMLREAWASARDFGNGPEKTLFQTVSNEKTSRRTGYPCDLHRFVASLAVAKRRIGTTRQRGGTRHKEVAVAQVKSGPMRAQQRDIYVVPAPGEVVAPAWGFGQGCMRTASPDNVAMQVWAKETEAFAITRISQISASQSSPEGD